MNSMNPKKKVEEAVRDVLKREKNIEVGYIYGSFAKGSEEPRDIDVGVVVKEPSKAGNDPYFESELGLKIEEKLKSGLPVEVRVLNNAGMRFKNQVIRHGKAVFTRNEKDRVSFETIARSNYFDFRPFMREYERFRAKRFGL